MALNRFGNMVKSANDKWRNKITDSMVNDVKDLRTDQNAEKAIQQMAADKKKADNKAMWDKYKRAGEKIDFPDFDAHVVDLPKEDVNEKEIVVDRTPAQKPFSVQGPTNEQLYDLEALAGNGLPVEEETSPDDATVVGETPIENTLGDTNNDNTTVEETPIVEEPQEDTFDESQVVEPEGWDAPDIPTEEEINNPTLEEGTVEEKPKEAENKPPKIENEEDWNDEWGLEEMAGNNITPPKPPKQEEEKEEKPADENKDEKKPDEKKPKEKKPKEKEEGDEEPKDKEKKIEKDAADVKDNTDLVKKGSGVSVDDIVNRSRIPHYDYLSFFR